jgi:AcrR family transcriptional regulator
VPRSQLTPEKIIRSAAALGDEAGFEAITLSAVARRLGVATPSLYSHVRDRDALLDGVTALALADLASRISSAIAGRAGLAALEAWADAHRDLARSSPSRWDALQRRAGEAAVRSAGARDVVALTTAVLRGYLVPESEHPHAIRLIGSTINGYLTLERNGGFAHSLPSSETSWGRVIGALDVALRAWPCAGPRGTP